MKLLKKYKLKTTNKPIRHELLSGVVHVGTKEGKHYAYISFSEEFVDAVGMAMPVGLSKSNPAYLKALPCLDGKGWHIVCMYLGREDGVLLWKDSTRPGWLGKLHKPKV